MNGNNVGLINCGLQGGCRGQAITTIERHTAAVNITALRRNVGAITPLHERARTRGDGRRHENCIRECITNPRGKSGFEARVQSFERYTLHVTLS